MFTWDLINSATIFQSLSSSSFLIICNQIYAQATIILLLHLFSQVYSKHSNNNYTYILWLFINLLMSTLLHNYSSPEYSTHDWNGSKPQKFKGGRNHNNHPPDELDNLLLGLSETQSKYLGPSKRRIPEKNTIGTQQPHKPHIRVNPGRNDSTVNFASEYIPKLIKLPKSDNYKNQNSILFRNKKLGQSKLKNLQTGQFKHGIYRNFYKSQFKQE